MSNIVLQLAPVAPDDGYTEKGEWKYRGELVTFMYRPALPKRVYKFAKANKRTEDEEFTVKAMMILEHVVSWEGIGANGVPVPINADNLARVPVGFIEKMLDAIMGYTPDKLESDLKT